MIGLMGVLLAYFGDGEQVSTLEVDAILGNGSGIQEQNYVELL